MDGITREDYDWLHEEFNKDPKRALEALNELFKDESLTVEQARFLGGIEGQLKQMLRDREAIHAYFDGASGI